MNIILALRVRQAIMSFTALYKMTVSCHLHQSNACMAVGTKCLLTHSTITGYVGVPLHTHSTITGYVGVPLHTHSTITGYVGVPLHTHSTITGYVGVPLHTHKHDYRLRRSPTSYTQHDYWLRRSPTSYTPRFSISHFAFSAKKSDNSFSSADTR